MLCVEHYCRYVLSRQLRHLLHAKTNMFKYIPPPLQNRSLLFWLVAHAQYKCLNDLWTAGAGSGGAHCFECGVNNTAAVRQNTVKRDQ